MSQWRRIALEAVPSCKRAIEESKNPTQMWVRLYNELYGTNLAQEVTDRQIYDFALTCLRTGKPQFLAANAGLFFEYVIGGYVVGIERWREDLPGRLSLNDFQHWEQWIKGTFPEEKSGEAMARFSLGKRKPQFRD